MLSTYRWPRFAAPRPQELDRTPGQAPRRVPVVVVGAGPVGLCAAIDAAQRGLPVVLLDEDDTVSIGSRGVCYAKRTLEILDRLGVGDPVVARGVTWNVGRTFHGTREVFAFDLLPEPGHRRPGMVNLQQYHLEEMLVRRAQALPGLELRWKHRVTAVQPGPDGVRLQVATADGEFELQAEWLLVADGARSGIRRQLGLDIEGRVFQDRFLIADVVLTEPLYPGQAIERRFWFQPAFGAALPDAPPCASALIHRQADDVWRIDFQLGWEADPEREKQPERVCARVRALLDGQGFGHVGFTLEWVSVYTFQCRRMARLRHDRVLFVGDAAHQVSPFGARGANSGIQDADNLVWKLALVQQGRAPEALLDSYDDERGAATDENLRASTRSTDFMTPRTRAARVLRDAVLALAAEVPAARALVNSGRLSVPAWLTDSPLNTPQGEGFAGWMCPGAPADDAPVQPLPPPQAAAPPAGDTPWLLAQAAACPGFVLLHFGLPDAAAEATLKDLAQGPLPLQPMLVLDADQPAEALRWPALRDTQALAARRYDARPGGGVLLRPDQHVAARWRALDAATVRAAVQRACAAA